MIHLKLTIVFCLANGMIGWKIRKFISRETNIAFKMYKTLIKPHIEYCTMALAPVSIHGNWKGNIKNGSYTKRDKNN